MQYDYDNLIIVSSIWEEYFSSFRSFSEVTVTQDGLFCLSLVWIYVGFTANTKCRKFETNIPRKGISGPQSQFPHKDKSLTDT
jgi:hypothetical protein